MCENRGVTSACRLRTVAKKCIITVSVSRDARIPRNHHLRVHVGPPFGDQVYSHIKVAMTQAWSRSTRRPVAKLPQWIANIAKDTRMTAATRASDAARRIEATHQHRMIEQYRAAKWRTCPVRGRAVGHRRSAAVHDIDGGVLTVCC